MSDEVTVDELRTMVRDAMSDFRRARCYDIDETLKHAATKYVESRYPGKHGQHKFDKIKEVEKRLLLSQIFSEVATEIAESIVAQFNERLKELHNVG